jgi:multisubunit Na+/H+ antiporter MnhB subunit
VVIGLTTLAYRYEGLRREDFDEVLGGMRISPGAGQFLWAITGNELTNIAWDFFECFFGQVSKIHHE